MSKRPRRIMHVITTASIGGAEYMLLRLLQRNDPERYAPAVLSLMTPTSLKEQFETLGLPLHTLGMRASVPMPASIFKLRQILRDHQPDLIQAWMYHSNLAATVGAWLASVSTPVLWNIRHSLYDLKLEAPLTRVVIRLNARLSRRPRAIIYNARSSVEQHRAIGFTSDRSVLIPNGFDCDVYRPQPELRSAIRGELSIAENAPLIGMISRYHPMKDPVNLLQAFAILSRGRPDARLIIAGRHFDQDNAPVNRAIAELGLGDRVRLLDRRNDIPRFLAALDVVALPSAWGEGFPNAIGEAMAAGIPCVATDIGDSAVVIGAHGRIVPPRNPEALAAALSEILDLDPDARRQLGIDARRHVTTHFELGRIMERFHALHDLFLKPENTEIAPSEVLRRLPFD